MLLRTSVLLSLALAFAHAEDLRNIVESAPTQPRQALVRWEQWRDFNSPEQHEEAWISSYLAEHNGEREKAREAMDHVADTQLGIRRHPLLAINALWLHAADSELVLRTLQDHEDALVQAYLSAWRAQADIGAQKVESASDHLRQARTHYRTAIPDDSYQTWQSAIVLQRIKATRHLVENAANLVNMGPAIAAYVAADKLYHDRKYAQAHAACTELIQTYPDHAIRWYALERIIASCCQQDQLDQAMEHMTALQQGSTWLAIVAAIEIGDAYLNLHQDLSSAVTWWKQAMAGIPSVTNTDGAWFACSPALWTELVAEPRHVIEYGAPKWRREEAGRIQHPEAQWCRDEIQFLLFARIIAAALYTDRVRQARQLIEQAVLFDPVARSAAETGATSATQLLAASVERGFFLFPHKDLAQIKPKSAHLMLWYAMLYDSCYDWRNANAYAERALALGTSGDPILTGVTTFMRGRAAYASGQIERATECLLAVPDEPGKLPPDVWSFAMGLRWSMLHQDPSTLAQALAAVELLVRHTPRSRHTHTALMGAALVLENQQPGQALSYLRMLEKLNPKAMTGYPTSLKQTLEQRVQQQQSNPKDAP